MSGYRLNCAYRLVKCPGHHRAQKTGYVLEHILIAEKALGHPLPAGAVVHHHDGNGLNNANTNLVICENHAYHRTLHRIMRTVRRKKKVRNPEWEQIRKRLLEMD